MIDNWEDIETEEIIDYSQVSVQELYRPVLSEEIPPVSPVGTEGYKWWAEQIKRCVNGWIAPDGRFINGYHYFFMNFGKAPIYNTEIGSFEWKSPLYRDNDATIMDIIWYNRQVQNPDGSFKNARNHVEAKARAIAWTTVTLTGIALYTFVFHPDKPIGNAYPDDEGVDQEREDFQTAWDLLHPMFKRWKGVELEVVNNNSGRFAIGEQFKESKIKKVHNTCRFDVIGSDKAGVYKGSKMRLMIAVEAGKWKRNSLKNYYTENEPSIKNGDTQWGMCLIGGTSNAIINSSTTYKEMFYNSESWNATRHFTPKTMVLMGFFDEFTGKSDKAGAYASIMKHRESKAGDAGIYHQEVIENPLTPEEAFIPNMKSAYNTALINEQINYINENHADHVWKRGKLIYQVDAERNKTGRVEFVESGDGEWMINREGLPNHNFENLFVSGIDDRYKSRDPNKPVDKEASRNAMVVWRQPTMYPMKSDMPCGVFLGEAADMNDAYEEFYKGMLFWDIKHNMYEYNADGFVHFLRTKSASDRLFYIGDNYLPGTKITPKVKLELTALGSQFFRDDRHKKITYIPLLEALAVWGGTVNTDIGSALHLVFLILDLTKNSVVTEMRHQDKVVATYIKLGDPNIKHSASNTSHTGNNYFKLGMRSRSA